eukprot:CAMPEP_0197854558 /NCGR_PEP_ID=MMETSP1438-20131217/24899_1 /TAXON_ID=1461541 /ORGANISM="Pterosperma sp., Strain CCMP1384" /LENGTH=117 /DNA_ID=CAMNT_0043469335 /DNA_START=488 /DNA_END=838 /DNA_ORIENTATION=+
MIGSSSLPLVQNKHLDPPAPAHSAHSTFFSSLRPKYAEAPVTVIALVTRITVCVSTAQVVTSLRDKRVAFPLGHDVNNPVVYILLPNTSWRPELEEHLAVRDVWQMDLDVEHWRALA